MHDERAVQKQLRRRGRPSLHGFVVKVIMGKESSEWCSVGMALGWVLKDKRERKANSGESTKESKGPGGMESNRPATALGSVALASCLTSVGSVFSSVK